MPDSLLHQIAITKIPKVGAMTAKNLISYCGGVINVFEADKKTLLKVPGIGEGIAKHILEQDVLGEAEKEVEFIRLYNSNNPAIGYNKWPKFKG